MHSSWTEILIAWLKFSEEAGVSSIIFQGLIWNLMVEWGELKPGWMAGPEGGDQWHKVWLEASNERCTPGASTSSSSV